MADCGLGEKNAIASLHRPLWQSPPPIEIHTTHSQNTYTSRHRWTDPEQLTA